MYRNIFQVIPQLLFIVVSLSQLSSFASPIQDGGDKRRSCPQGWLHYEKFCVAKGVGSSDKAVAIYCDGFGGIGIKGLCIIRAQEVDTTTDQYSVDTSVHQSDRTDHQIPLLLHWSLLGDKPRGLFRESELQSDEEDTGDDGRLPQLDQRGTNGATALVSVDQSMSMSDDTGVCPKGWTLYGNLCVFKPWSVKERCLSINAVEFNGLCLKHADTSVNSGLKDDNSVHKVKRICCCASIRGRPNKYGC